MDLTARPHVAAAAALVAAGLVAAAPVAGAGLSPAAGLHDVQLTAGTSLLGQLEAGGLNVNSGLIGAFEKFNLGLTGNTGVSTETDVSGYESDLLDKLFEGVDKTSLLHGFKEAAEQFLDGNNAELGLGQNLLMALMGANGTVDDDGKFTALNPAYFNAGLFVDHHAASYLYGGLESIFAHYFGALSFAGATALGMNGDDLEGGSVGTGFASLASAIPDFNSALIKSELAFNENLVGFEKALFGDDNEVFNHAFNSFNLLFDTPERLMNTLIGATGYHDVDMSKFGDNPKGLDVLLHDGVISDDNYTSPQDLTHSLLLGDGEEGKLGGLQGALFQNLAMWTSLGDLLKGGDGLDALFSGANFDEFGSAFSGFFTGLEGVFTPFTDFFEGLIPA